MMTLSYWNELADPIIACFENAVLQLHCDDLTMRPVAAPLLFLWTHPIDDLLICPLVGSQIGVSPILALLPFIGVS